MEPAYVLIVLCCVVQQTLGLFNSHVLRLPVPAVCSAPQVVVQHDVVDFWYHCRVVCSQQLLSLSSLCSYYLFCHVVYIFRYVAGILVREERFRGEVVFMLLSFSRIASHVSITWEDMGREFPLDVVVHGELSVLASCLLRP